ncbi:MAG TPA: alpha-L-fucosidase [bacterium]|nr:alpha-L-fucosidase [bacterium]
MSTIATRGRGNLYRAVFCAILFCWSIDPTLCGVTDDPINTRIAWWREARFGVMIRWGLHALPGSVWNGIRLQGPSDWIQFRAQVPSSEYATLAAQFNAPLFNPDEWIQSVKLAGAQYLILPAKSYDGFCLFNSDLTDFKITATPFGRDLIAEVSEVCRRENVRFGIYYSILDWHHPDYLPRGPDSPRPWDERPTDTANYDRYIDYVKQQLEILLTRYGKIDILWFDGAWEHTPAENHAEEIIRHIHSLQPDILINNRLGVSGDFISSDSIPEHPDQPWELGISLNDTWGFKRYDVDWKESSEIITGIANCTSAGGNLLLNIGPEDSGAFPPAVRQRLNEIGESLRAN